MARKIVAELMSHQSSSLVKEKQLLIAAIVGCENPPPPHSFLIILGQKDALMPNCWHIWAGNGLFSMGWLPKVSISCPLGLQNLKHLRILSGVALMPNCGQEMGCWGWLPTLSISCIFG